MSLAIASQTKDLRSLWKRQEFLIEEVKGIKAKLKMLGSLSRFEDAVKKGRHFARERGIRPSDVLTDD